MFVLIFHWTFSCFFFHFQKCLDKDPARRWSCEQLLHHNFFKQHSFKIPNYEETERGRVREREREREFKEKLYMYPTELVTYSGNPV